jgi:tripartite-type tricarboxylate transporter receptor subunit TctC
MAPAGTPPDIIDKLNRAGNDALKNNEVEKALAPQGLDLIGGSAGDFARFLDTEMKRWATVAEAAGLKKK